MANKLNTLGFDNSGTGFGKTYCAIDRIAKKGYGLTLAAAQTNALLKSHAKELVDAAARHDVHVPFTIINSKNSERDPKTGKYKSTRQRLKEALEVANKYGFYVIFITHETLRRAFTDVSLDISFKGWNLLIDEAIDLYDTDCLSLTKMGAMALLEVAEFVECDIPNVKEIKLKEQYKDCGDDISKDIDHVYDSFFSQYKDLIKHIITDAYSVYAVDEHINNICAVLEGTYKTKNTDVAFMTIINKDTLAQFKSVDILCANFETTNIYKLFKLTRWKLKRKQFNKKAPKQHTNGHLIEFAAIFDGMNSNTFKRTVLEDGLDHEDVMINTALHKFEMQKFITNANVDSRPKYKGFAVDAGFETDNTQAVMITDIAGVNSYDKHTNVLYLTCNRISKAEKTVFEAFGITEDEANYDRCINHAYQLFSRCAVRDASNTKPILCIVACTWTRDALAALFPGSKTTLLDSGLTKGSRACGLRTKAPAADKYIKRWKKAVDQNKTIKVEKAQEFVRIYKEHNLIIDNYYYAMIEIIG